ncbi:cytochrome c3 family protein [Nibricoccus sp. IMCC34717]|uniref:cytochrome c3 family protein n=1 Tax=Nibricoccus sp. IMCC34717 TaxID=3034021 RepID=UPI00384CFCA3
MLKRICRYKKPVLIGALAGWGLLLISCVVVNRTIIVPPQVAGAEFVGSKDCVQCHEDVTRGFHDATHAKLMSVADNPKNIGCESCHGPGSIHSKTGGEANTIINPARNPETCFQCHLDKRGEFALPHVHPAGKVSCSDCHEPHKGDAVISGGTNLAGASETCFKCHDAQRGPYVFEHEALRENCTTCHNPHGSVNDKMLKARNQTLCLQCHFQQQTITGQLLIGGRDHAPFVQRGTCWSAGCHEAVHGSHVNSSLRF